MLDFARKFVVAMAILSLLIVATGPVQAAGALAVGACGAYGYGYDYGKVTDARAAAMKQCVGSTCKIVGEIRRGCAALAIDAKRPCGSFGWAINSHLGKAENASLKRCYEFGGRDCVVRAWACDDKG
jgi:Domain of unknown function (DUF4189)